MTGRVNRSRENVAADKSYVHSTFPVSISSGISVQELKKITAWRIAQQHEKRHISQQKFPASQKLPYDPYPLQTSQPKSENILPPFPQEMPSVRLPEPYLAHVGEVKCCEGVLKIPSGLSVQELKELTKRRLAREASSNGSPSEPERVLEAPPQMCSVQAALQDYQHFSETASILLSLTIQEPCGLPCDSIPEQVAEFVLEPEASEEDSSRCGYFTSHSFENSFGLGLFSF